MGPAVRDRRTVRHRNAAGSDADSRRIVAPGETKSAFGKRNQCGVTSVRDTKSVQENFGVSVQPGALGSQMVSSQMPWAGELGMNRRAHPKRNPCGATSVRDAKSVRADFRVNRQGSPGERELGASSLRRNSGEGGIRTRGTAFDRTVA